MLKLFELRYSIGGEKGEPSGLLPGVGSRNDDSLDRQEIWSVEIDDERGRRANTVRGSGWVSRARTDRDSRSETVPIATIDTAHADSDGTRLNCRVGHGHRNHLTDLQGRARRRVSRNEDEGIHARSRCWSRNRRWGPGRNRSRSRRRPGGRRLTGNWCRRRGCGDCGRSRQGPGLRG